MREFDGDGMTSEYEKQLIETIERQERELVKCREWMDSLCDSLKNIKEKCTKQDFNKVVMEDLQHMHNIDMLAVISDYIRGRAPIIAEEEIAKIREKYGK